MAAVLIISDDSEFCRSVVNRWQTERLVPEFTLMNSVVWNSSTPAASDLVVVGPVEPGTERSLLTSLGSSKAAVIVVADSSAAVQVAREVDPRLLALRRQEGWLDTLLLLAGECLRRVEACARARHAEEASAAAQRQAMLGRYILDMRHAMNNALTSVLGNAELLLLEPGALSAEVREQILTMHNMALRLHDVMQRFSSLESEMLFSERHSPVAARQQSQPSAVPN